MPPVIEAQGLSIAYRLDKQWINAIKDVNVEHSAARDSRSGWRKRQRQKHAGPGTDELSFSQRPRQRRPGAA